MFVVVSAHGSALPATYRGRSRVKRPNRLQGREVFHGPLELPELRLTRGARVRYPQRRRIGSASRHVRNFRGPLATLGPVQEQGFPGYPRSAVTPKLS
jgi:hypothetical protein